MPANANAIQPGHEYTKGNVKFAVTVMQSEAIKKLENLVNSNKQTQGKSTIGDEKVRSVVVVPSRGELTASTETQRLHAP